MKKVLIIGMSPLVGGIESFIIQNYRHIDKNKINFDFLTFYPRCAFEEELEKNGSKIFHLTRRGENPIKCFFEQKSFFKSHKDDYDFVWIHLSSASNIISNKLTRKYTTAKIISHCHGVAFESKGGLVRKIHSFLDKKNFSTFIKCTDFKFACSKAAAKWLFKTEKDVEIIKNGIDFSSFVFNNNVRNEVRKELNIQPNTFVIGHAGRFCDAKNHEFLINVFSEFHKLNKNSVLLLAGSGELEDKIKSLIEQNQLKDFVKLLGFRNDVNRLYQAFDIFLLPSLFEGFPVSAIEAQVSGLQCVLSDKISDEINISGKISFLPIEPDSVSLWVNALLKQQLIDRNIQTVENKKMFEYDIYNTAKFIEDFLYNN